MFENKIWKCLYFSRFSRIKPPFLLTAETYLAADTSDHKFPHGTLFNNSLNPAFNSKLYFLCDHRADLKVLDLGCSGGGFVRSILEDGYTAIGVEGSNVSKCLQAAEWATIPLHLFNCDITKPFNITDHNFSDVKFDVITAWEVLEHIPESEIPDLIKNIRFLLSPTGYFIASVATFPDENPLKKAVYHSTLHPKKWWLDLFQNYGFQEVSSHPFTADDWVRGSGQQINDWHPSDNLGFHLVLQ